MKTFNIGDNVYINHLGKSGKVIDKMYSEAYGQYFFEVEYEGTSALYQENELSPANEQAKYHFTIEVHEGAVIAVLYETIGDTTREIERNHGHVMHQGALGVAQAASYALKKIYTNMAGGKMLCYNAEENRYE